MRPTLLIALLCSQLTASAQTDISTLVGTATADTRSTSRYNEEASEAHGQTIPAVLTPHGQNSWTPQTRRTEEKCVAPYYYADTLFQGFRNSHWITGGCTQDYGSFTIAPDDAAAEWPFSHDDETALPYYYRVHLPTLNLTAELTALSHAAILRFSRETGIRLIPNSDEGKGRVWTDSARQVIYGENPVHRIYQGWGEPAGFSGYICVYYGAAPTYYVASSFTSAQAAWDNLLAETDSLRMTFGQMADESARAWAQRFHTIEVDDPDSARVRQFYGAIYRASILPREISDCNGSYPRFADGHTEWGTGTYYGDFSMWDIYRAQLPLLNIIDPQRSGHMMQSLVTMAGQGGWLPIFPCWNSYTAAMIGDHCAVALADAYVKGIRNFDAQAAYRAMRRNAFRSPSTRRYRDGMGRRALPSYLQHGYIPLEDSVSEAFHRQEQTSRTLEYAFDDFAVAQMAKALGHRRDYNRLMARAGNWRNVINPITLYADGRHADGTWLGNQDQYNRLPFITEGATCHYTLYVPHDLPSLIDCLGGKRILEQRLDTLFEQGYYWHGNEPCHHIVYLYNACDRPDKTRRWVRHILQSEYNDSPGGLSGNDDAGQMSAWYVLSAMGFYPVCPATPCYELGLPTFRRVTLHLDNGHTFTIQRSDTPDDQARWLLNGQPVESYTLSHDDILRGGTLTF